MRKGGGRRNAMRRGEALEAPDAELDLPAYSPLHPIWPRDRNGEPCHGYVDDSLPGLPSVTCCMSQQLLEESVIGGANDACHAKGLHTKEWKSREGQRRGNS